MNQQISSTDNPISNKAITVHSHINPWLTGLIYPLACYVVMPTYFGKIEIRGRENIPKTGPVIVAPTHRSRWDALVTPYAVGKLVSGREMRFMVMANEMQGFQGFVIRQLGGYPVNTVRPGVGSFLHTVELLQKGEMVVIFPEGGIFRQNQVQRIKPGVARIALEVANLQPDSHIKILPVGIQYSQPYPRWGTEVRVNIGPAIDVTQYQEDDLKKNTQRLTSDLKITLQQLEKAPPCPNTPSLLQKTAHICAGTPSASSSAPLPEIIPLFSEENITNY